MTLFFYILKDYLKYVVGTILLTVFLFVLFDLIQKTSKEFAEHVPATLDIVHYYLLETPGQVVQAMPIASLLASVITMILLSRTNEVTAMRAAGMGPLVIGLPLAAGGLALSASALLMGEFWIPQLAQKVHYIHEVQMLGEKDDQLGGGAKWLRNGQSLVNFQDYDALTETLTRVKIVDIKPNFRPLQAIEADKAVYNGQSKQWQLRGIKILHFRRNGTLDHIELGSAQQEIALPLEPKKLKRDRRKPNELSIVELRDLVKRGDESGADTVAYKVELNGKLAYPFAAFVVSLIGLKFGYKSERSTETAKGVLLAFFIGISYWFVLSAGRALGLRGDLSPFVAAWLPNFVILSIIGFEAWMNRRL